MGRESSRRSPEDIMIRTACLAVIWLFAVFGSLGGAVRAQDVPGIELCTRETSADRRTGCLQSNIQYLHGLIAKTAADAQQKLGTAANEIGALKGEVAALKNEIAALKAALAVAHASIDKLQAAAAKRAPADKPAAERPAADKAGPDKPPAK